VYRGDEEFQSVEQATEILTVLARAIDEKLDQIGPIKIFEFSPHQKLGHRKNGEEENLIQHEQNFYIEAMNETPTIVVNQYWTTTTTAVWLGLTWSVSPINNKSKLSRGEHDETRNGIIINITIQN